MNIAIDLRSLSSGSISGVENYILNLLDNLFSLDSKNHYTLFNNSLTKPVLGDFNYINTTLRYSKFPSKLVNLALKFKFISLEKLTGEFDCLFMPNLNQFNVSPNAKVILTVHDLSPVVTPEFYNFKRMFWHKFLNYKKAFERADQLLAVSEYTKQDLIKIFKIDPNKIKVIYPGVDSHTFHPNIPDHQLRLVRNTYSLPGEFILFLNTIEPRKNLPNLIKAFERLNGDANLVIAGKPGWKYKETFRQIKNSKKSAKIKYVGYVEEKHKPALIKLAKILAYPSFYEGFGFQPLEAMAIGTPVVASQLTSIPEIVGNSGILVDPYNIDSLTTSLNTLLNNNDLREQLISKGQVTAKKFLWQNTARGVLESFNSQ